MPHTRTRRTLLALLLLLPLLASCSSASDGARDEAAAPSPTASATAGCSPTDDAEGAVCRFLSALDSGDTAGLTADEVSALGLQDGPARGPFTVESCAETGCRVTVRRPGGDEPQTVSFTTTYDEAAGREAVQVVEVLREVDSELSGCPVADVVDRTACEFLTALQTDDPQLLRDSERAVLARSGLPPRPWRLVRCALEGDVTVACRVDLGATGAATHVLTLEPVNAEYDGEQLQTDAGKDLDYAVTGVGPATGETEE